MKLKTLLALSLLLPIFGFSSAFNYIVDGLSMQYGAGQTAKKYAEEKFGKGYSVVSEIALGKVYKVILQEDEYPYSKCSVSVLTPKKGVQYVPKYNEKTYGVTSCGKVILMRKVSAMVKDKVVSKYFKNNRVGVDITCGKENCNLPDNIDIFNFNNYWSLSAKDWIDKFYPYLQVNRVVVSIFNTPKSAENIAKAMKMVFELNKHLYNLTGTHQIGGMTIYIYNLSQKKFKAKYKNDYALIKNGKLNYNYWLRFRAPHCKKDFPVRGGEACYDTGVNLSRENINNEFEYIFLISKNKEERVAFKETKYYQPVKQLLEK